MKGNFIVLFRKFTQWEWYTDVNVKTVFLHCLLKANWETKTWRGSTIERGSFVTSWKHLADETGLSVRQVRTACQKLENTGELTRKCQGSNSLIVVNNYNQYQDFDKRNDSQMTTTNNINKETINNILSLSINGKRIGKREREILKSYCKRHKVQNVNAYISAVIKNGDYIQLIEEEKEYQCKSKKLKEQTKIVEVQESPEVTEAAWKRASEKVKNFRRSLYGNKSAVGMEQT